MTKGDQVNNHCKSCYSMLVYLNQWKGYAMYEIEKDLINPDKKLGKQLQKYPIMDMKIGDSFKFSKTETVKIRNAAAKYKIRHTGWDYVCRSINDSECRLWRIT